MSVPVVGIAGCGALGSLFACRFSRAGFTVILYDNDTDVINAIRRNGLESTDPQETLPSFRITASDNPSILAGCHVVFIFVKTYSLERCVSDILPSLDDSTLLVSLQNGIGNYAVLAKMRHEKLIVFGTTAMGATLLEPGLVRQGGTGPTVIGGADISSVETVRAMLEKSGFETRVTKNPYMAVWEKAIINSAINPLGAMFNLPNGMLIRNPDILSIQHDLVAEACAVARAMGMNLDTDDMARKTRTVCEHTATNLCSMLQDIRAGRKTEIDSINGTIAAEGEKHGMTCHSHLLITRIIHALELSAPARQV